MSGFPSRMGRLALGPLELRARRPTISPDQELSPEVAKLLFWQVSGVGLVAPLAGCLVNGATGAVVSAWSAWRPDAQAAFAAPTPARTGPGVYSFAYAASYLDQDGTEVATALRAARVTPQSLTFFRAAQKVDPDGRSVQVRTFDAAGVAADVDFLLEVQ